MNHVDKDPAKSQTRLDLAKDFLRKHQLEAAEAECNRALAFNASNQLAVRQLGSKAGLPFTGTDLAMATARLESSFRDHTALAEYFSTEAGGRSYSATREVKVTIGGCGG
jgi:hypothetical protein